MAGVSIEEVVQILDQDSDDNFEGYNDETDDCEGNQELNSVVNNCVTHEIYNQDTGVFVTCCSVFKAFLILSPIYLNMFKKATLKEFIHFVAP